MKKTPSFLLTFAIMSLISIPAIAQHGLQITSENTSYTISFETSISTPNVNYGEFTGQGFQPTPSAGQLDSNAWEVHGLSDGDLSFGGTETTGDFARGTSGIPVAVGGIYSFVVPPSNNILGMQANTNDLTPGSVTLRIQNKTGVVVHNLNISYVAYIYNDQSGKAYFGFEHSADNSSYIEILDGLLISGDAPATSPTWNANNLNFKIEGLSIAPNAYYYLKWTIKNTGSGALDQYGLDNITVLANPPVVTETYVYDDNMNGDPTDDWTPSDPNLTPGNISSNTNFLIQDGTAILNQNFTINKLTVAGGAAVEIKKSLRVQDGIENDGEVIFVSNATTTGQLGDMTGATITGTGSVTVQLYIPANDKGAYRYITSAVNSIGSINANWQEGANSINDNPKPNFGMFITGSSTGSEGFDETPAGDPSMFNYDINASEPPWAPVPNTNSELLVAGHPYAAYVWGDRSVDIVPDHDPDATNTTLRAKGSLVTGDQTVPLDGSSDFNLIGNPYQAIVNMRDVVTLSTNVNNNFYYVWDPNLGTRGANTTVSLIDGSNNSTGGASDANQYLMPGQGAFVLTTGSGASLLFTEDSKAILADETEVFRPENNEVAFIQLQLYQAERFANGQTLSDGLRIIFSETGDNAVLLSDAPQLPNMDENLARTNGTDFLSIENRALPTDGEILPLMTNQYRVENYVFRAIVNDLPDGTTAYLIDNFLDTSTELSNNETSSIDFTVNEAIPASIAPDRFSIEFSTDPLSVNDTMAPLLSIYPNPVQNGKLYIAVPDIAGQEVQVVMYNVLGQQVQSVQKTGNTNERIQVSVDALEAGVYMINVNYNGKTISGKVIVQ